MVTDASGPLRVHPTWPAPSPVCTSAESRTVPVSRPLSGRMRSATGGATGVVVGIGAGAVTGCTALHWAAVDLTHVTFACAESTVVRAVWFPFATLTTATSVVASKLTICPPAWRIVAEAVAEVVSGAKVTKTCGTTGTDVLWAGGAGTTAGTVMCVTRRTVGAGLGR